MKVYVRSMAGTLILNKWHSLARLIQRILNGKLSHGINEVLSLLL